METKGTINNDSVGIKEIDNLETELENLGLDKTDDGDSSYNPEFMQITEPEDLLKKLEEPEEKKEEIVTSKKDDIKIKTDLKIDEPEDTSDDNEIDDLGEYEADIVDYFSEQFAKELDWKLGDDEKPKSVKEVVDLIKKVVEENSEPDYGDERVKTLDEFVKAGGRFEDFYGTVYQGKLDLEKADIEDEKVQKAVLKEHLINTGYKESAIEKKLSRWEDAGVLQEEAEEALESVKEFRQITEQRLLEEQKNQAIVVKKQQQKFYDDVHETIKNIDNIRGIQISDKEKKELLEYAFKVESDGATRWQKEQTIKNMLEAAYFSKNADSLIKKIEKSVETKTAKKLKDTLASNKRPRGINQSHEDSSSSLLSISSQLLSRS